MYNVTKLAFARSIKWNSLDFHPSVHSFQISTIFMLQTFKKQIIISDFYYDNPDH